MTAAKSFHRKDIGGFARALKCIPVVRPEDNESKGAGFITTVHTHTPWSSYGIYPPPHIPNLTPTSVHTHTHQVGAKVKGTGGTRFTQDFAKGSIIVVKNHKEYGKLTGKVSEVISDTEMVLAGSMQGAPLEKAETATEKEEKSYNRAMSVRTTLMMVMAIYYPLYTTLLPFFPDYWWPLVHMISFQLACWSTNVVYHIYRSEDAEMETLQVTALAAMRYIISRPEPARGMSQSGSGESLSSTQTPSTRSMKRSKSLSQFVSQLANTDHSTDQPKAQEEESTKIARDISEPMAYTYLPFVDQSDMFENVYDHLGRGGTIGIFPEGGTHDGTKLLPLKWGISTMVLGAMAKYEGREPLKISVVPVGLNYFNPHKFRRSLLTRFRCSL
jgi:hypothetical protein